MRKILFVVVCVGLACGDDAAVEDAGNDGSVEDAAASDGGLDGGAADALTSLDAGDDAGTVDTGPGDTGPGDGGSADSGLDGGPTDAGMDAGCGYLDLGIFIADCASGYVYVREWSGTGEFDPDLCPTYYTVGATRFDTLEAALASDSCDPECLRGAGMSVTLLRCGRRTGYIVYRDRGEDCDDAYETPDGIFPSIEAWDEAHPCE